MQTIGIMANAGKEAALEAARAAAQHLRGRGVAVPLPHPVAEALGVPEQGLSDEEVADRADAVLVLGGDGTILATSRLCAPRGTPMLPVHLGRFGFLTEVAPPDLTAALDSLLEGRYHVEERMMLWGETIHENQDQDQASFLALNDIAVANGPLSRVLHLRVLVDGQHVTTLAADGVIVATPTGSTAYSLSAGGPLVHPRLQTLLVTPICPHTLTARALLIPPDSEVTVIVERDPHDTVRVTVDGQLGFPLMPCDQIRVRRAPHPACLVTVGGADFYDKLQSKLRWGEGVVY
ncbi:MAG: NAD(+)/NADH kinase [Armatimonadota bacterium]|nr:NAD(+)/NADH kinase [Armatimonadota bacterium]